MTKFLADENIPLKAVETLRQKDIDITTTLAFEQSRILQCINGSQSSGIIGETGEKGNISIKSFKASSNLQFFYTFRMNIPRKVMVIKVDFAAFNINLGTVVNFYAI